MSVDSLRGALCETVQQLAEKALDGKVDDGLLNQFEERVALLEIGAFEAGKAEGFRRGVESRERLDGRRSNKIDPWRRRSA